MHNELDEHVASVVGIIDNENSKGIKKISWEWKKGIGPVLYLRIKNKRICFCFCHHRKDRSIKFFGIEKYFCSRDLGVLFGSIIGIFILNIGWHLGFLYAFLLGIPMILDGSIQGITNRNSKNIIRILTGFFFGISAVLILGGVFYG